MIMWLTGVDRWYVLGLGLGLGLENLKVLWCLCRCNVSFGVLPLMSTGLAIDNEESVARWFCFLVVEGGTSH